MRARCVRVRVGERIPDGSTSGSPIVQPAARKAKLIGKAETLRAHDFRAAFACRELALETGVNVVQQMLGHSSPAMTLSYARLVSGEEVLAPTPLTGSEPAEVIEIGRAA